MDTSKEILEILFKKNRGYLKSKELQRNSTLYLELSKMKASGLVEKMKPGLYRHKELVENNEWIELSQIYSNGVFCMFSAWYYYELSTMIPSSYYMAFPNKTKIKKVDYPPVKVYYWSDLLYNLEIMHIDGISIYSLEKSVCDAVKFRNKIGIHLMTEILRNYLKRKDKDLNSLFKTAKIMKMDKLLNEYLNLML
jgi:predicted transcriptional regulator of viral defense system